MEVKLRKHPRKVSDATDKKYISEEGLHSTVRHMSGAHTSVCVITLTARRVDVTSSLNSNMRL